LKTQDSASSIEVLPILTCVFLGFFVVWQTVVTGVFDSPAEYRRSQVLFCGLPSLMRVFLKSALARIVRYRIADGVGELAQSWRAGGPWPGLVERKSLFSFDSPRPTSPSRRLATGGPHPEQCGGKEPVGLCPWPNGGSLNARLHGWGGIVVTSETTSNELIRASRCCESVQFT
jgi:hypothetical protein